MPQLVRSPAHFPIHIQLRKWPQACSDGLNDVHKAPHPSDPFNTLMGGGLGPLQSCPPSRKHQSLDKEQKCRQEKDSKRMPYSTCSIFLYRPCFLAMVSLVWVEKHNG